MNATQAYLYKWTHRSTSKWYIGSRTKQGANHPCHKLYNQVTCEHCGMPTQKANYTRWHRINCKELNHVSS